MTQRHAQEGEAPFPDGAHSYCPRGAATIRVTPRKPGFSARYRGFSSTVGHDRRPAYRSPTAITRAVATPARTCCRPDSPGDHQIDQPIGLIRIAYSAQLRVCLAFKRDTTKESEDERTSARMRLPTGGRHASSVKRTLVDEILSTCARPRASEEAWIEGAFTCRLERRVPELD